MTSRRQQKDKGSPTPGHESTNNLRYWLVQRRIGEGSTDRSEQSTQKHKTQSWKRNVNIDTAQAGYENMPGHPIWTGNKSVLPVKTENGKMINVATDIQSVADTGVWVTNKKQYDDEFQIQQKYQKRIAELEGVIEKMCDDYDLMYKETVTLYEKINNTDKVPETYNRVLADRQILRDAEEAYKRRISAVQNKTIAIQETNKKLELEIKQLKNRIPKLEDQFKKETQYNKLHWEKKALMSETETLKKQLRLLKNELTTNARFGYFDMSHTAGVESVGVTDVIGQADCGVEPGSVIIHELEGQLQHLSVIKRHQMAEIQNLRHNIESTRKEQDVWNVEKRKYDLEIKHLKIRLAEAKKLHLNENTPASIAFTY